jgi:hypothetical protein
VVDGWLDGTILVLQNHTGGFGLGLLTSHWHATVLSSALVSVTLQDRAVLSPKPMGTSGHGRGASRWVGKGGLR